VKYLALGGVVFNSIWALIDVFVGEIQNATFFLVLVLISAFSLERMK